MAEDNVSSASIPYNLYIVLIVLVMISHNFTNNPFSTPYDGEGTHITDDKQYHVDNNRILESVNEIMEEIVTEECMYQPHRHGMFTHSNE